MTRITSKSKSKVQARRISPEVFLISRPYFNIHAFNSFLQMQKMTWNRSPEATHSDEVVEVAGRICYMSFGKNQSPRNNREYIKRLVQMGHESVLEHVNWTFLITGVSRAFTHQLVRHRAGFSFSQLSQQYHDETEAEFIVPSLLEKSTKSYDAWRRAMRLAQKSYREILNTLNKVQPSCTGELVAKEIRRAIHSAARSVLPSATESKIVVTANARAFRHFLSIRGSIPGDEEMRSVGSALLRHLQDDAPSLFFDFSIAKLPDGSPMVIQKKAGTK